METHYNPDEWIAVSTHKSCPFHERFPGRSYAGCTCSGSFGLRRATPEEQEAKRQRRIKEDTEIAAFHNGLGL